MKKIFISVDIEGVCGVTHWDETEKNRSDYEEFRVQMTSEVAAACEGAFQAGVSDIVVRDAHDSARNIIAKDLPEGVRLIRGWSGHPYCMMHGVDSSFDAVMMIGYHAGGGYSGSPLSHTMTNKCATSLSINGKRTSELYINTLIASLENIPTIFVTGDAQICNEAQQFIEGVGVVATKEGVGDATMNFHPYDVCLSIRHNVMETLRLKHDIQPVSLPEEFDVEIAFVNSGLAYKNSFYPGATLKENNVVAYHSDNFMDVLRFFQFTL